MHYNWNLKEAKFTKDKGKVFSCFSCGGGSTMGYKLAWFDVIGGNDIDERMAKIYIENHKPKYFFTESITTLKERNDLPQELYELDILDWSPPCSTFSLAWEREKAWWKEKHFREWQAKQVLDTLFFDFIDLAQKLQPKVVVAENVMGLFIGKAQNYVAKILEQFDKSWYNVQYFFLNASTMGVPQERERCFFIALRKDLCESFMERKDLFTYAPRFELKFNEKPILLMDLEDNLWKPIKKDSVTYERWLQRIKTDHSFWDITWRLWKESDFNTCIVHRDEVCPTILTKWAEVKYELPIKLSNTEMIKIWSFPSDYDFWKEKTSYVIWMSVPPIMMWKIAEQIWIQWLSKL